MPIDIQVWLYECSSRIDIQVAQKVDDHHTPKLLNWQTVEIKPRYKKLMNTIFSDVNNKFKFSNITPTPRELAVLQLPPEGIENQVEGQYSNLSYNDSTSYEKNADDDFQEPPPPIVKDKRKGKICSSPSPVKKRTKKQLTDGAKQAVQKMEPRLVVQLKQHLRILTFQEQANLKCKS
ncbi:hypothetical protein KY284_007995 [Solanum tuberosum]|nr:hypothetical protein KY284_007995 [Solanum tuberosum]